jgi:hypothetical protein
MQGKLQISDYIIDPRNEFRVLILNSDASLDVYDWTDGLLITVRDNVLTLLTLNSISAFLMLQNL